MQKYFIVTFGCQMNYSDSERFAAMLETHGLERADSLQEADLVIINSCSVRQKAEDRVIGLGKKIRALKKRKSNAKAILTGCMVRRSWKDQDRSQSKTSRITHIKKQIPWLDEIVETSEIEKFLNNVTVHDSKLNYLKISPHTANKFTALIPISIGCNHFCSYCIVPYSRGQEKDREFREIIKEVLGFIKKGYKDINLLGQTVNSWRNPLIYENKKVKKNDQINVKSMSSELLEKYRVAFESYLKNGELIIDDLDEPIDYLQLIQVIDQIPGEWLLNWMSSHPNYMTSELITYLAQSSNNGWCTLAREDDNLAGHQRPYLHFAIQSGSNNVLKRMNRSYTKEEFLEVAKLMKEKFKKISLSTDIIVGFPDESEEDFQETVEVMKDIGFGMAYISEYSPRSGTAADKLEDDVPHNVKEQRKTYLNDEILMPASLEENKALIDTEQVVLVTGYSKRFKALQTKTVDYKAVLIENSDDKNLIGEFVKVKITSATPWALKSML